MELTKINGAAHAPGPRETHRETHRWADRLGVLAAAACAVHCMAAPLVLAAAPLIGGAWASPKTHWAFAAVSIPAALSLLWRNLRGLSSKARRGLISLAVLGSSLVLVGLAAPGSNWAKNTGMDVPYPSWLPSQEARAQSSGCQDECCASVHASTEGERRLFVPLASLLTMAGGLLLVAAHGVALRKSGCCDPG